MFKHLPSDIINNILEFNGTIKYRTGIYINQINVHDTKYDKIKEIIYKKEHIYDTIKNYYGLKNPYYIEIYIHNYNDIKYGIILDYYYFGNNFVISTYKDIRKTEKYLKKMALNKLKNEYTQSYFVEHYIYQ